ncbi:hypothetical protein GE061_019082 [Apolygus lucorum]|uniref:Uncharacterized protein n=1 Tax=Apolygus lucorum TaxID=248454 RepID=A0A8S9X7F5_APOLU|nr:hypothetical protein GE061_019082 [Apolygus lucorum]
MFEGPEQPDIASYMGSKYRSYQSSVMKRFLAVSSDGVVFRLQSIIVAVYALFKAIGHLYNGEDQSAPSEPPPDSNASSSSEEDF